MNKFQTRIKGKFPNFKWNYYDGLLFLTQGICDIVSSYLTINDADVIQYWEGGFDTSITISEDQIPKYVKLETKLKSFT